MVCVPLPSVTDGGVVGGVEKAAELDEKVFMDGLLSRRRHDDGFGADRDLDLAVVLDGDISDGPEERHDVVPLDVAARRVLGDLAEGVAVVLTQVRRHVGLLSVVSVNPT